MMDQKNFDWEGKTGLDLNQAKKILNLALSTGGDFADFFFEYRLSRSILMEEDLIKETSENISLGLGIRVIKKDRTGYAYTSEFSLDKIKSAALTAAAICQSGSVNRLPSRLRHLHLKKNVFTGRKPATLAALDRKIDLVKKAYHQALKYDPLIKKVQVVYGESIQEVWIVNSEGLSVKDTRPMTKLIAMAIAEKNGRLETGFYGGGGRIGLDYFADKLTAEEIGREAAREACLLLEATEAPAGEFPVVLAPGHSGVLVHEAVGHLLEADFIRKKTSVFSNSLGKKVASELINIYDDPTIPGFRGSYNVDDEGHVPEKTLLIDRGRVVDVLTDRLSARLLKKKENGHGRRQDYTCWPLPRMSNTYISSGEHSAEEIIRSVKKGLYVSRLSGGQVEDSGHFTFSITLGYLIEDGHLTRPVSQATLIGHSLDILKKVEMVGGDLDFGLQTGTCGKEGQEIPVSDGCPTLKIKSMTIGGTK